MCILAQYGARILNPDGTTGPAFDPALARYTDGLVMQRGDARFIYRFGISGYVATAMDQYGRVLYRYTNRYSNFHRTQ